MGQNEDMCLCYLVMPGSISENQKTVKFKTVNLTEKQLCEPNCAGDQFISIEAKTHKLAQKFCYKTRNHKNIFHYSRCKGGGLEFLSSVSSRYPMLCGENGRYSPPVVMFGDDGEPGQVLITVEDITPRTQWLLHYSFTDVDHSSLGVRMSGGVKNQGGSGIEIKILCFFSYLTISISTSIHLQLSSNIINLHQLLSIVIRTFKL